MNLNPIKTEILNKVEKENATTFYPTLHPALKTLLENYGTEAYAKEVKTLVDDLRSTEGIYAVHTRNKKNDEQIVFEIIVLSRPCVEYERLNAWLESNGPRKLHNTEITSNIVIGKYKSFRTVMMDSLLYSPQRCNDILALFMKHLETGGSFTMNSRYNCESHTRYDEDHNPLPDWAGECNYYSEVQFFNENHRPIMSCRIFKKETRILTRVRKRRFRKQEEK